uniref:SJCHGC09288 protein n=1 Tax=Schistosoma japonicum TaxID=6182 RepID=Q5DHK8_SCHJA|nr:SJCHGC09288 protein [Schistosoma japonicum]
MREVEDYVKQYNVQKLLRDCIVNLCLYRPSNPIAFLREYFAELEASNDKCTDTSTSQKTELNLHGQHLKCNESFHAFTMPNTPGNPWKHEDKGHSDCCLSIHIPSGNSQKCGQSSEAISYRYSSDADNLIPNNIEKNLTETVLKVDSNCEINNSNEDESSYDGVNGMGMRGLMAASPSGVNLTRRRSRRGAVSGEVYTEEDAASYVKNHSP